MNKLQQIASDISGYDPINGCGAHNDYYYELKTLGEKVNFFRESIDYFGNLTLDEIYKLIDYLNVHSEITSTDEAYHLFMDLK